MNSAQLKPVHLVILLCLVVFALSMGSIASQRDGLLRIYFFNIGQGDAILTIVTQHTLGAYVS